MHFAFTEDQLELGAAVRDLLASECTPQALRAAWADEDGMVRGLWEKLAEMGVPGLCIDEADGGLGMTPLDAALPLVACGWAGVPDPVVDTALVAPGLLAAAGRTELMAPIAAGNCRVAAAPLDAPTFASAGVADVLLVVGFRPERDGARFAALVDRDAVTMRPVASVDGARRLSAGSAERGIGDWGDVLDVEAHHVDRAVDRALVGTSCLLLGLAERMLDLTVAHVSERKQFGVAIGSFQAVKHHCADSLVALDMARPVVWRAAWSLANLDPRDPLTSVHAAMAKAYASDAAATVAARALQCHAGIGYTTEYDLHLYMKRAWALQRAWGDGSYHLRRIASAVLDGDRSVHPAPERL